MPTTQDITVIVPHMKKRAHLFSKLVFPMIMRNEPHSVIVDPGDGPKAPKMNKMAKKVKTEFMFLCDDDIILNENCLEMLVSHIGDYDVCYCGHTDLSHPKTGDCIHTFRPFSYELLRFANHVPNMSLIRTEKWLGMDEDLEMGLDWDMWIRMAQKEATFILCPHVLYTAVYREVGITDPAKQKECCELIRKRYGYDWEKIRKVLGDVPAQYERDERLKKHHARRSNPSY